MFYFLAVTFRFWSCFYRCLYGNFSLFLCCFMLWYLNK
nr:MAG TPA: hypothetical protein [Caudoviricetes sp.]